jgi:hypothetical protein
MAKFSKQNNGHTNTFIQHNNAKPHFDDSDIDWVDYWMENQHNWNFELKEQSLNSPNQNILDLGFFNSLQSLQFQKDSVSNIDELIANVKSAFNEYDPKKLNWTFLTH